jgi:hypothetical protein
VAANLVTEFFDLLFDGLLFWQWLVR